jgi:hypothetical protein
MEFRGIRAAEGIRRAARIQARGRLRLGGDGMKDVHAANAAGTDEWAQAARYGFNFRKFGHVRLAVAEKSKQMSFRDPFAFLNGTGNLFFLVSYEKQILLPLCGIGMTSIYSFAETGQGCRINVCFLDFASAALLKGA